MDVVIEINARNWEDSNTDIIEYAKEMKAKGFYIRIINADPLFVALYRKELEKLELYPA